MGADIDWSQVTGRFELISTNQILLLSEASQDEYNANIADLDSGTIHNLGSFDGILSNHEEWATPFDWELSSDGEWLAVTKAPDKQYVRRLDSDALSLSVRPS